MRAAPPVHVQLPAGQVERWLIAGLHGLAGAAVCVWGMGWLAPSATWFQQLGATALATVPAAALGWRVARSVLPPVSQGLGWTGQAWQLRRGLNAPLPVHAVHVQIDLGHWLLLRFSATDGLTGWLVATLQGDPVGWHLFRVALQAHGGAPALSAQPGGLSARPDLPDSNDPSGRAP